VGRWGGAEATSPNGGIRGAGLENGFRVLSGGRLNTGCCNGNGGFIVIAGVIARDSIGC
jgi:hypothetical protein